VSVGSDVAVVDVRHAGSEHTHLRLVERRVR
jgi:hypothetical protein